MNNSALRVKLNAIADKNNTAFAELYNELKTPIYTIINRIVWDRQASQDIMQEVFLKLYLSPPSPSIKNPRAYIFQMARNLAIDNTRKALQSQQYLSLDSPEIENTAHSPSDDLPLRMDTRIDIESALKRITAPECQIVTLHLIGELKFREIAEIMSMPLGTVLWRYQKAIEKLRKLLS